MKKLSRILWITTIPIFFCQFLVSQNIVTDDTYDPPPIYEGYTIVEDMNSPSLEGNILNTPTVQPFKIYLPTGYYKYPKNKYPVIYLLHGYTGNHESFYTHDNLLSKLNGLISTKLVNPAIIVTPCGKNKFGGSYYTNSSTTGNWEDYIIKDVIIHTETNYQAHADVNARGLAGFSMGGYGAAIIGIKHPSIYKAVATVGAVAYFENFFTTSSWKEGIITAAILKYYNAGHDFEVRMAMACAAAFAPDSTVEGMRGHLPFTEDGELVDSIWQVWLKHDPLNLVSEYTDSLQKLGAFTVFIGEHDFLFTENEAFHNELVDNGVQHEYHIYNSNHSFGPILDELLSFFSNNLQSKVPIIENVSMHFLETSDTLLTRSSQDGEIYIVPTSRGTNYDSIFNNYIIKSQVIANNLSEIIIADLDFDTYNIFAVSNDSMISNLPEQFHVVPDKSLPEIELNQHSFNIGDSIKVKSSKNGKICVYGPFISSQDTIREAYTIMNSSRLRICEDIEKNKELSLNTDELRAKTYWIFVIDPYGIVGDPISIDFTATRIAEYIQPQIQIYPNPTKGELYINYQLNTENIINIDFYNIIGKHVTNVLKKKESTGSHQQVYNTKNLSPGIYLLELSTSTSKTTIKVIIQN